jgi:hypothetical protein
MPFGGTRERDPPLETVHSMPATSALNWIGASEGAHRRQPPQGGPDKKPALLRRLFAYSVSGEVFWFNRRPVRP